MKAIPRRDSVVTYVKSCLIFQISRFKLISKYLVIYPLIRLINSFFCTSPFNRHTHTHAHAHTHRWVLYSCF